MAISFVGAQVTNMGGAASSGTFTVPASGLQVGDLMLVYVKVNSATATVTSVTGWDYVTETSTFGKTYTYSRIFQAGDDSATFTANFGVATTRSQFHVVAYRGVVRIGFISESDSTGATSAVTHTSQTNQSHIFWNVIADNSVVVYSRDQVASSSGTMSWSGTASPVERTDDTLNYATGAFTNFSVADAAYPTAGTSPGTVISTATATGSGTSRSYGIVLSPAASLLPIYRDVSEAQRASAGTSLLCNYPAISSDGDLLVMSVMLGNGTSSASTITDPAGWTLAGTQDNSDGNSNGQIAKTYWKYRGAETSETVTHSSGYSSIIIHAYRGETADPTNPINSVAYQFTNTDSTSQSTPALTTTAIDCAISLFANAKRTSLLTAFSASWGTAPPAELSDSSGSGWASDQINKTSARAIFLTPGTYPAKTITYAASVNSTMTAAVAIQGIQNLTKDVTEDAVGDDFASGLTVTTGMATDSGAATESTSQTVSGTDDTALETDSASVIATGVSEDTAVETDSASVIGTSAMATDDAALSESAYVSNAVQPLPDDVIFTEETSGIGLIGTDTADSVDTATVSATALPADDVAVTESATVLILSSGDSADAVDTFTLLVPPTADSAVFVEQTSQVLVTVFGSDSASGTEPTPTQRNTSATDSIAWFEIAFKSISGQLVASRKTVVAYESRTYRVPAEVRVLRVEPEYRLVKIGEEI